MAQEKSVCFAGHRNQWQISCSEETLTETIEKLINDGYTVFYDGGMGYFDYMCRNAVTKLKQKYDNVKLIKVLTYYHYKNENNFLPNCFDETIYPSIEEYYFKQKIIKRNEWIIDNCDVLVCNITETYKSGAYRTVKYAQKKKKQIIYI
ncbi:MAG: hypothetical protein VZQ61_06195 [Christensenellaceae bacterium]